MIDTTFRCDAPQCRNVKGEGNRWLMYKITKPGVFLIRAWDKNFEPDRTWSHLCSDQCAIKLMTRTVRQDRVDPEKLITGEQGRYEEGDSVTGGD